MKSHVETVPRGKVVSSAYVDSGWGDFNRPSRSQRTRDVNAGSSWRKYQRYLRGDKSVWNRDQWELIKNHDFGHEFVTESGTWDYSHPLVKHWVQGSGIASSGTYAGPMMWPLQSVDFRTDLQLLAEKQELWTHGASFIAKTKPKLSHADLGQALGELRKDGIPALIGSIALRSRTIRDGFRSAGSEYLNYQFGWAPLVRDVMKVAEAASRSRELLEKRYDEVGKLLSRRMYLDPQSQTTTVEGSGSMNTPWGLGSTIDVPSGSSTLYWEENYTEYSRMWFSGAYRFAFPDVPEALKYLGKIENDANILLGTRLDPELLYNLAPWTWFIDWFVNIGDVVGNLTSLSTDHVNIHHAYIMKHTRITRERTTKEPITLKGRYASFANESLRRNIGRVSNTVTYERKVRYRASPFGFGLTFADLTPYQQAILLALGVSRI